MKSRIAAAALALAAFIPSALADGLLPVSDSFVALGNNSNFGVSPTINVGGAGPYRGLIQFDLATLPPGTTAASVSHANLVLFVNKVGTAGAIDINAGVGPWTEGAVNGSNTPAIGMTVATGVSVSAANVYIVVDATAVVKAWLSGNPPNQGFIITANVGFAGTSVFFDSKESASTSHPAILDISFLGAGAAGPAGPQGPVGLTGSAGPQGPIGLTGAAGSLTLPFAGSTTFYGNALAVQNFQLGSGNNFSGAAIAGTGGTSFAGGGSGGSARIGISSTDTQPGIGGIFNGGASGPVFGGIGIGATGGNSVFSEGGSGAETEGGTGRQSGGHGILSRGGAASAASSKGGTGVGGVGGTGQHGGNGGEFYGANGLSPGDGIVVTAGQHTDGNQEFGLAAHFVGDVQVIGSVSKQAGSFKIDHPLDPANKYLYHSFVESPDMMNIYNGIAALGADGSAWVEMPDWFEALNQEFRYQLTSMDAPGPNLYVAARVAGNRFRIAGGLPGASVSWQITGIRHDAYADAHRVPVEQLKKPEERGRYLQPDLFHQPREKRIGFEQTETMRNR